MWKMYEPIKTTNIPYKSWPLRERIIEQLYRLTHNGQIRTLVIRDNK